MRLKEFLSESIVTDRGVFMLKEKGIDHIETLPVPKFIAAVRSLAQFQVTEKLDGANLVFGFDNKGKFYTSREAKGGAERMFETTQYPIRPANNGFAAAHDALNQIRSRIRKVMSVGEACEVEVLFGRQPNAIVYGSNHIAFLRMLPGDNGKMPDQTKARKLHEELNGTVVKTLTPHVTTTDGRLLETNNVGQSWKFASVSVVDSNKFADVNVEREIEQLERFLEATHAVGLSNGSVANINLTSVPKDDRPTMKAAREETLERINEHKLQIKEKILDQILRVMQPALRDVDVSIHEDLGVEGVVLLNPSTLEQLKIVDKDVFTVINQFNHAIRNEIKASVGGRSSFNATLRCEGDIFGNMLKKVAESVGDPDLGYLTKIKRVMRKYQGSTLDETVRNFSKSIITDDSKLKHNVEVALTEGLLSLEEGRVRFLREWQDYSLKLSTGKEVRYTTEIKDRTLIVFAEVRQEMEQMRDLVRVAESRDDVVVALYGRQLKSM